MEALPMVILALCAAALVSAVFMFSRSLAAVFGDATQDAWLPHVLPEDRQTLLDEKRALLVALRDLETERQLGKVGDDDYERLEAQYRGRARNVLKQLDGRVAPFRDEAEQLVARHLAKQGIKSAAPAPARARDAKVGKAAAPQPTPAASSVEARREEPESPADAPSAAPVPSVAEAPEPAVADGAPPVASTGAPAVSDEARACASCSTVNDEDAAFCKKCGTRLEAADA